MYRLLLFIFLFISSNAFSQTETTLPDSLPNELIDSAMVVSDSVFVNDSLAVQKIISDSLKALQQKADSLIIFNGTPLFDGSIILSHSDLLITSTPEIFSDCQEYLSQRIMASSGRIMKQ
jgi:hypothetical protein